MSFRHEAMLYAGDGQFLAGASAVVRDGIATGEPTLVMVPGPKIAALREELGDDAEQVLFADMEEVGKNPGRIIPAWREFADRHAGKRLRGIGEPVHGRRDPDALVECQQHESLLNVAFANARDFRLICPYDVNTLPATVIDEARRSHPTVLVHGHARPSSLYRGVEQAALGLRRRLPEPPPVRHVVPFGRGELAGLRRLAARHAGRAGLTGARRDDAVLAVSEVAANSVRHAGGHGTLRVWREPAGVVFEVRDGGRIHQPLVGRRRPGPADVRGRGLWLAHQLSDLVQVRSSDEGTVVRLRFELA